MSDDTTAAWGCVTPLVDAETGRPLSLRERFNHAVMWLDRYNADALDELAADLGRHPDLTDAERLFIIRFAGDKLTAAATDVLAKIAQDLERDHAWLGNADADLSKGN